MNSDDVRRMVEALLFEEKNFMDHYKQKLYQARFEQLKEDTRPLLDYMAAVWEKDEAGFAVYAREWAGILVDAVQRQAEEAGVLEKKRVYRQWMDEKRAVVALYVLPLFEIQRRDYADLFREEVYLLWNETFPSHPVMKATYADIMQGFKKRGFGCYITSAVCQAMNRSDDSYELSAFRKFRDDYLVYQPDGEALIREYYETAPKIVEAIGQDEDAEQIYCQIWEHYLSPCLEEIEAGENEACKQRYVEMVRELQKRFL